MCRLLLLVLALTAWLPLAPGQVVVAPSCPSFCPRVPTCPRRQEIVCELDAAITAGTLRLLEFTKNTKFGGMFSDVTIDINLATSRIRAGLVTDMSDVVDLVTGFMNKFRTSLSTHCLITIETLPMQALLATTDEVFRAFYASMLTTAPGVTQTCGNRVAITRELAKAFVNNSNFDAVLLILSSDFSNVFGSIATSISKLLADILSKSVTEISQIAETLDNNRELFIQDLEEQCYYIVNLMLREAIERSFDARLERFVLRLGGVGGSMSPEMCPNRPSLVTEVTSALNSGSFPVMTIIRNPLYHVEFGLIATTLNDLRRGINTRVITDVTLVLETLREAEFHFTEQLGTEACLISIRNQLMRLIRQAFDLLSLEMVNLLRSRFQPTGPAVCPRRLPILTTLNQGLTVGVINAFEMTKHANYQTEFGAVRATLAALYNEIIRRLVRDRATITARLDYVAKEFLIVISDKCLINVSPEMAVLIENHFRQRVEAFCKQIP